MTRTHADAEPGDLPLSALLSQVLVAFTIEFDNEFERQMVHRTTRHGSGGASVHGPWLVSLVMWANCMQFVSDDGIPVRELYHRARTKTNLNGMQRWGYIAIEPNPADPRPKPPRSTWLIRAKPAGRKAREVWRPLFGMIEKRWEERFGEDNVQRLRKLLWAVARQVELDLPDCLPILGFGLFSKDADYKPRTAARHHAEDGLPLSALLSQVLLAFAIDFEIGSDVSLAMGANILRVLEEKQVRVRDLPVLSGVSKEAISMALGLLARKRLIAVEADSSGGRGKAIRLTKAGLEAKDVYGKSIRAIEQRWKSRFGEEAVLALRRSLEGFVGVSASTSSPLFGGLEPYPEGWRASVRKPDTLPHYPMVLHRGGFPDGS